MDEHSITLSESIWDVATLSAQTLDFMQMLLGAYEVHALYVWCFFCQSKEKSWPVFWEGDKSS